ncbi:Dihydrolipoyl dehydrogenase (Dihydrolipoamide dehydrogenase) (E3 component of pyruvate complex) [Durusdinium trenchii]|uniref:Dihydrolipoyl dehydrogenase (Dihydrolipoamide dehydrogenase) (E3 component of pyruvate complex) n=1 Tax=Durusdinium trenchii TaxID=1381693 RepID=A0ABP0LTS7_9DINO
MGAYREARKYTNRIALIDGGPLGTTCARVGCMPSKLLIAAANAYHDAQETDRFGVRSGAPSVDGKAVMARVRSERDRFVGFVMDAVEGFDEGHLIREFASFVDDHTLKLSSGRTITARAIVIATGSRPNVPPPFQAAGERLIVNDDLFDWDDLPQSVAVFGAGVIGLELGQALSRLGVRVRLFGRDHFVGPISDPKLRDYAADTFEAEFPAHWHADTEISNTDEGVLIQWKDENGAGEETFDFLLAATGRRANIDKLGLENTSLELAPNGVPVFDPLSGRAGESHIFIAGDAVADLPLLHEAADEGRLAGENAARLPHAYRRARRAALGVVFSEPQIAIAGQTFKQLTDQGAAFEIGEASFEDQGRARVMGVNKGLLRVYGEKETGRLLGAEMVGPQAEHLAHLIAWAIQSGQTVSEVLQNPFYHPVVEEGLRTALRTLNNALGFGPNPPLRCIDCGPGA